MQYAYLGVCLVTQGCCHLDLLSSRADDGCTRRQARYVAEMSHWGIQKSMKSMLHEFYVSLATCMPHTDMPLFESRSAPFFLYYKAHSMPHMISKLTLPECHHATVTLSLHG